MLVASTKDFRRSIIANTIIAIIVVAIITTSRASLIFQFRYSVIIRSI